MRQLKHILAQIAKKYPVTIIEAQVDICSHEEMEIIKEHSFLGTAIFRKCKNCSYRTEH